MIRFLVEEGIVPKAHGATRSARYGSAHEAALRRFQELKAAGFTLAQIKVMPLQHAAVFPVAPGIELRFDPSIATATDPETAADEVKRILSAYREQQHENDQQAEQEDTDAT